MIGAGNRWTDHVRAFANKNGMKYMCALSDPECSASYRSKPREARERESMGEEEYTGQRHRQAVSAKKRKGALEKRQAEARQIEEMKENEAMGREEQSERRRLKAVEDAKDIRTHKAHSATLKAVVKKGEQKREAREAEAMGSNDADVRKKVIIKRKSTKKAEAREAEAMGLEDLKSVLLRLAEANGAVGEAPNPKKKRGRPQKYATAEEARLAKIANTILASKRRKNAKSAVDEEGLTASDFVLSPEEIEAQRRETLRQDLDAMVASMKARHDPPAVEPKKRGRPKGAPNKKKTGKGLQGSEIDQLASSDGAIPVGTSAISGAGSSAPDWEHIKWGSFTQQFQAWKRQHPNPRITSLSDFADVIVAHPDNFQPTTLKRARFYLNVLSKK